MLIKLEKKRDCGVSGLSFHSKRPWILAGLNNGVIELWDYSIGVLINSFHGDQKGSVRALHSHNVEPIFVSGGDDCEIKVWSYKLLSCMFSLLGHEDRIRSVQFHPNEHWIISGSNDKTIRIWNWETQTCICTLSMHYGPVICASFHPNNYLALSASTDDRIRVWNIETLIMEPKSSWEHSFFFAKHVIDDVQVTWASFHPSLPLIVSGGNDKLVKIWKMQDSGVRRIYTLRGHVHAISCVLFHARQDVIISSSQDKTIRVWNHRGVCLGTISREESLWLLASHPSSNLLGACNDNGFIVFKLARERPAFFVTGDVVIYIKNRVLYVFDYLTREDVKLMSLTPHSDSFGKGYLTLSYNPENAVLISSDKELDFYELYTIPKRSSDTGSSAKQAKRGIGGSSVFVAHNRFAVLNKSCNQLFVKNLNNDTVKKIFLPITTDIIFAAENGNLLCGAEGTVFIFDLQQQIVLAEMHISFVRHVVWSVDMENVALLGKYLIVLSNKKLVLHCKVHEKNCVKSGAWDENGIFVYTTKRHMKYCLPNGETGIIKSLGVSKYITKIYGSIIFCLDRDGKNCPVIIDSAEYMLKLSLLRNRYDEAMSMVKNAKLFGQSMIAYLEQKGFPELSLLFVKDERTRFSLALKSGNIQVAVASAEQIDEQDYWNRLGVEALCLGNTGIAEYVYQRTKNFGRLSFLYLITGNLDKLLKVIKIAEVKNDLLLQFHYALYLGDVEERVKILENAGHLPLAHITASVHGLRDTAEYLAAKLVDNNLFLPKDGSASRLMIPPKPILCGRDWSSLIVVHEIVPNTEPCVFIAPPPGRPVSEIWVEDSSHAAEQAAAGNFCVAFCLLGDRYGMRNFCHFKSFFTDLYLGSQSYLGAFPSAPVISTVMDRHWNEYSNPNVRGNLALIFNFSKVKKNVEAARELLLDKRFSAAFNLFQRTLHVIPLTMTASLKEGDDLIDLTIIIKDYLLVTKILFNKAKLKDNPVRQLELAAYSTHVTLSTCDARLVLFNAMTDCYKAGNKKTAAKFAERLLHANPSTNGRSKNVDKVLEDSAKDEIDIPLPSNSLANLFKGVRQFFLKDNSRIEDQYSKIAQQVLEDGKKSAGDLWKMNYNSDEVFYICALKLNPIYYERESFVFCPYCEAYFVPSQKDQICTICDLVMVKDEDDPNWRFKFPRKYYSE